MFTGLVEGVGRVARVDRRDDAVVLAIEPRPTIERGVFAARELAVGESVCHDGACLTVTAIEGDAFVVLAGAETLARTTLGALRVGSGVNLERALRVGDRLGGHWVTGHVDGTGALRERRDLGSNLVLEFAAPAPLLRFIVEKGSIAVAGVSLTVNLVTPETFGVALIPHTREHTTLGELAVGAAVNLETDILAKHVAKLLEAGR
jgi:riboflavin synthase